MSTSPKRARSAVVLVDEAVLCCDGATRVDHNVLDLLLTDIASLWEERIRCTIVLSGGATLGRIRCGNLNSVARARREDVWAAIGSSLLQAWLESGLSRRGLKTGSLHLTRSSFADRHSYGLVRDCLRGLEANEVVPVIWDNSWVDEDSSGGFRYPDQLMALLAGQAGANIAIVGLGEEPGVFSESSEPPGRRLSARELTAGMRDSSIRVSHLEPRRLESIIAAARLLGALGIPLLMTSLKAPEALRRGLQGEACGLMIEGEPTEIGRDGVKRWLSTGAIPQGAIVVSPYAATQLAEEEDRSSLLAAGVVEVVGEFREGDVVAVEDELRRLLGYGVTKYGSDQVIELRGERNVVIVHADYFFGLGLQELIQTGRAD